MALGPIIIPVPMQTHSHGEPLTALGVALVVFFTLWFFGAVITTVVFLDPGYRCVRLAHKRWMVVPLIILLPMWAPVALAQYLSGMRVLGGIFDGDGEC